MIVSKVKLSGKASDNFCQASDKTKMESLPGLTETETETGCKSERQDMSDIETWFRLKHQIYATLIAPAKIKII